MTATSNTSSFTDVLDVRDWLNDLDLTGSTERFLSHDFDVKEHANNVLQSGVTISSQLAKISEGILLLNKELHSQVVAHHDNLLSQASGVETLEGVLQMMHARIQSLLSTTERIRGKVTDPFNRITMRMKQLTRLQETCDILRRVIRILYLTKRLKVQQQGGVREITKTAQSLSELRSLSEGVDLSGIEVLEHDRRTISQARLEVESQAQKMLYSGMANLNQNQVGTALQVFYNLNLLKVTVDGILDECRERIEKMIDKTVDQQALAGNNDSTVKSSGPGRVNLPVNSALFRANLWTAMEKLMDSIYSSCSQVHHLHRVLSKKRDPVTQVCFISEYSKDADADLMNRHWKNLTSALKSKLTSAAGKSNLVKQALESEFPKLLRLLSDLWSRLNQAISASSADAPLVMALDGSAVEELTSHVFDAEKLLREAVSSFNNAYLSRSLSRLFDPINLVFPQGSVSIPSDEEIGGIVKTISSELQVASFDDKLAHAVSKNVTKTVQMFAVKCEQLLSTDGEASQVIEPATAGQKRNSSVVNSLFYLQNAMLRLLESLTNDYNPNCLQMIIDSVEALATLMRNAVQPLFNSIKDSMEAIILTMHQEDFSSAVASQNESQCSLYMRELQSFLARVQNEYISLFECTDFVMECIQPFVCNGIELFVRHASLIRPLGDGGKMRLAADFAQMELAVHPLCKRVGDLGKSYKLIRAFRPLLFQSTEHILQSPAIGDVIPISTVLHYLFTRAPEQLLSPHQVANWSLSRYTHWLENHPTENDRLVLIKGALEAYAKSVTAEGMTEYASVYPAMLQLLHKGLDG
ncbi:conserved oligomeric Golgi complex subunit 5-like isoform X2 [Watersipora subatra]|uniref:conserved oligomeric Golgi complex subunit 5-like isoform X2 n=1 Tax=Watersipora subatra TaxID=2589382 RepID=UPI00355B6C59